MQLPLDLNLIQHLLNSSTVTGDLNDLTTTGFYYVSDAVNAPTSAWPHVIVNANDDKTKVVQLAIPDGGDDGLFCRKCANGKWTDWQHIGETTVTPGPDTVGQLTKIPENEWVAESGLTIDKSAYFRSITVINLGDNALVFSNQQFTTTTTLAVGWHKVITFPTSYLSAYQGAGKTVPFYCQTSDTTAIGDVGIDKAKAAVNVYVGQEIPSGTKFNFRSLCLVSKDTNILN